ncbi:MAG: PspC domain-containing protein [Acidimicrobiales bacterium]
MTQTTYSARTGEDHLLRRSRRDRMLAGVASGLADYFDVDVTLVRIAFVVLTVLGAAGIPVYAAAWLLIPEEGSDASLASELLADRRRSRI